VRNGRLSYSDSLASCLKYLLSSVSAQTNIPVPVWFHKASSNHNLSTRLNKGAINNGRSSVNIAMPSREMLYRRRVRSDSEQVADCVGYR